MTLPQANPTLDKPAARIDLAGAGVLSPLLKGLGGSISIDIEDGEILDSVRIHDDYGFESTLSGSYSHIGSGRLRWQSNITLGTHTSSGSSGGNALRNFLEWTIRRKYVDPPSGKREVSDGDRAFFDTDRAYSHVETLSLSGAGDHSSIAWNPDTGELFALTSATQIHVYDRNGSLDRTINLTPVLFYDTRAICYMGNGRWAVLCEGAYVGLDSRLVTFYLDSDDTIPQNRIEYFDFPSIQQFPLGYGSEGLAYDPVTGKFYVSTEPIGANQGGLWEIDVETEDSDGYASQTLLFHWHDIFVAPGHVPLGAVVSDISFTRDLAGGIANNSIFVLLRDELGDPSARVVCQVDIATESFVSKESHGFVGRVEGLAFNPKSEELWIINATIPEILKMDHEGYEISQVFERQFWVKDLPSSGSIYIAGQEAQNGTAVVYLNEADINPYARDASTGIAILPNFSDEFFAQQEYVGNRYANTLRNIGGISTVELFIDGAKVLDERSIWDLAGYYWDNPGEGTHTVVARVRSAEGSGLYRDITGTVEFQKFAAS